jgi:hypothetical protein
MTLDDLPRELVDTLPRQSKHLARVAQAHSCGESPNRGSGLRARILLAPFDQKLGCRRLSNDRTSFTINSDEVG